MRDNVCVTANSTNDQKSGYDNLQSHDLTYYHSLDNPKWHTATETWYMFQDKTPNAPDTIAFPFYGVNGPLGAWCQRGTRCRSHGWAIVNYTMYEFDRHNAVGTRTEFCDDVSGQQTGVHDISFGWNHCFSDDVHVRPEVDFCHALNMDVFNNGTRRNMGLFLADLIMRH
jgi:Putative beta-barrel porin-2, OmpL-like. bbp2